MGLGIPPLKIKIVPESNPLKSTMLVGRLGVVRGHGLHRHRRLLQAPHRAALLFVLVLLLVLLLSLCLLVLLVLFVVVVVVVVVVGAAQLPAVGQARLADRDGPHRGLNITRNLSLSLSIHVYIYIYICLRLLMCIYIYI